MQVLSLSFRKASPGNGGLTEKMRKKLVSAALCAIRMRSKEPDRRKAVKLLERDLINGPRHCFGHRDMCSSDFCSTAKQREGSVTPLDMIGASTVDRSNIQSDETTTSSEDDPPGEMEVLGKLTPATQNHKVIVILDM